jgi:hypothetical protein
MWASLALAQCPKRGMAGIEIHEIKEVSASSKFKQLKIICCAHTFCPELSFYPISFWLRYNPAFSFCGRI